MIHKESWSIVVSRTAGQKIAEFTGGNWQWIWAAFVVPIVGWVLQSRKSRAGA